MAIDSHTHINSSIYNYECIKKLFKQIEDNPSIDGIVNVGMNLSTSVDVLNLSYLCDKVYCSVGIHPLYVRNYSDIQDMMNFINNSKVVAVGEIGLDDSKNNLKLQKRMFIEQIMIANSLCLPVIIHASNTLNEIKDVFEHYVKPKFGCVFHCFQPDLDFLDYAIKNGYYISYAGRITSPKARLSLECIKKTPNELLMVETDSPYIPIHNILFATSLDIDNIINKVAEVKNMDYSEVDAITTENTKRLFYKMK